MLIKIKQIWKIVAGWFRQLDHFVSPLDVSKNVARIKSCESLAEARKELFKDQELVVIDMLTGGNSCGTFLLHCLPKIYHTPKSVLDYISKWKTIIGNPPFGADNGKK